MFLAIALPLALVPAALAAALSGEAAARYTKVLQPALLLLSSALALWVALMYRSDLKRAFLLLAVYLLSYGVLGITPLVEAMRDAMKDNFLTVLLIWQVVTYGVLIGACLSVLRTIGIQRIARWGLPVLAAALMLAGIVVINGVSEFRDVLPLNARAAVLLLLIRILDMLVVLLLVPVVLLYIQHARATYQESTTFLVVVAGIVASLVLVYVYEAAKAQPLAEIVAAEFQQGSLLDALSIFIYATVPIGLVAHRKHQEWSLSKLEQALA